MAIVSAPPERMTETAAGLLAAAAELGYPPQVVATTGDTPLGLGFLVPDDVAAKWQGHALQVPEVPEVPEVPVDVADEPEPPAEPEPKPRGRRGPAKPVTDGPEV